MRYSLCVVSQLFTVGQSPSVCLHSCQPMAEVDFGVDMVCVLLPNYQKIVSDAFVSKVVSFALNLQRSQKYQYDSGVRRCNLYLPQMWYKINLY